VSKPKTSLKEPTIDNRLLDERGPTIERLTRAMRSPLEYAQDRGQITHAQYAAGQKFYTHWYKGGLCEHYGTLDLSRVFGGGDISGMPKSELQAFHRHSFRKALELLKAEKSWALQQLICNETPAVEIGFAMGARKRETALGKALSVVRDGLDMLCVEWDIQST